MSIAAFFSKKPASSGGAAASASSTASSQRPNAKDAALAAELAASNSLVQQTLSAPPIVPPLDQMTQQIVLETQWALLRHAVIKLLVSCQNTAIAWGDQRIQLVCLQIAGCTFIYCVLCSVWCTH
jgi:hypothetical protein